MIHEKVAKIDFPLEYWEKRNEFLKQVRRYFLFGKVRMTKSKDSCSIIFYYSESTSPYYLINGAIYFGAWLNSKGYVTIHNKFNFKEGSDE